MRRITEKGLHLETLSQPLKEAALVENQEPSVFHKARFDKDLACTRALLEPFIGSRYEGDNARQLCMTLLRAGSIPDDRCAALEVSLAGRDLLELDRKALTRIALFFNANRHCIWRNQIIPVWTGTPPQWMYLMVADARYVRVKEKLAMNLRCPVLTGVMAGRDLLLDFSPGYVRYLMKEIGIGRFADINEREISGMYLLAKVGITKSNHIGALAIKATAGMKKLNRGLHKARDEEHCSQYRHACYECGKGRDQCSLACRTVTTYKENTQ